MPNGKNWRYKLDRRQPWWNTANKSSRYFAPSAELIGYIHAADTIEHKVSPAMKRLSRYDGRILRLQELRARRLREEAEGTEGEEGTEGDTDMEMETSEEEESDEEMERFRDWSDVSSDDTSDDTSDEDSSDGDYYKRVGWRLLHGLDDGYTLMCGRDEDMDQFRAWSDESTDSSDEDSSDEDYQDIRMYDGDARTGKQGQGYDEEMERFRDWRDDVTHGVSHYQNPSDQDLDERVGRPLQRQPYTSLSNTPSGSRSASSASNPNEDKHAISQGNPPDLNEEPFEWAFTMLLPEHDHHSPPPCPPPPPPPAPSTLHPRPQKDQDQPQEPSTPPTPPPPPPPQRTIIPQQQHQQHQHSQQQHPHPTTPPTPPPPPPPPKPKTKKRKAHPPHDKSNHFEEREEKKKKRRRSAFLAATRKTKLLEEEQHGAEDDKKTRRSAFLAMRKAEEWMD